MQPIHFFRPGRHVASNGTEINFSEARLAEIASSYSPALHEAPIVVGHPKTDAPAYGWVDRVEARPDGLYAVPKAVNAEFAELVRRGAYKKVSGSFFSPDHPNHPKPGSYYLRHIGFLGAMPPAVKGLQPVNFTDEAAHVIDLEDSFVDLREHSLKARERAFRRRDVEYQVHRLNAEGRLPKGEIDAVIAFVDSLEEETVLSFSDGEGGTLSASQRQWFLDFMSSRPLPVVTREIAVNDEEEPPADFVVPPGYTVDPATEDLHRNAVLYQRRNNVSYAEAVAAVARR